jgi:hypothetical protein
MGAVGFMGSLACLLVLENLAPPPSSLAGYALTRSAMASITTWVYFPSFLLMMIPGLLSIAVTPAFHNAGWVWMKAATGILLFEAGLHVLAPIQEEARLSAEALAGRLVDLTTLTGASEGEANNMWVLLVVSTANIVLGVWRPRFTR